MSRSPARIAVAGAGLVGRRHAEIVAGEAVLAGIADPAPAAGELARELGVPHRPDLESLLAAESADAVIVATPNQRHEADALTCIRHRLPMMIEKPIADSAKSGRRMVEAAERAGVPLLTGHHRRYNPIIHAAKQAIDEGRLGRIVSANAICWLHKPEPYFDVEWRRKPGAGPVFINLIHDVELLQHLCGPVAQVMAAESNAARGNEVEDTAAAILTFANGAIGTVSVSDAVSAPWSWELTASENPAYPATGQSAYLIGGSTGSLSVPDLNLWRYDGAADWMTPIEREKLVAERADPLVTQIRHLAAVALEGAAPMVDGRAGLSALQVIEAIKQSAQDGAPVALM